MDNVLPYVQHIGLILLVGMVLYAFGAPLIRWVSGRILKGASRHSRVHRKDLEKRYNTLSELAVNIWRISVVVGVIFVIARVFFSAADLAPLFASAGIIGVAFGFGAQSLVKDFLSGVFIISENQYRVGDVIEIDGFGGTVERIGTRSTVIRDVDGNVHYFPNGIVQHVINKTMGFSKSRFELSVTPESDIDRAIEIINEVGETLSKEQKWEKKIIEAPKFVMLSDVTAMAVNLVVSGTTQPSDQWSVTAEMRRRILEKFEREKDIALGTTVTSYIAPKK